MIFHSNMDRAILRLSSSLVLFLSLIVAVRATCPVYCPDCGIQTNECCPQGYYWTGDFNFSTDSYLTTAVQPSNSNDSSTDRPPSKCEECRMAIEGCGKCERNESHTNVTCYECGNDQLVLNTTTNQCYLQITPERSSLGLLLGVGVVCVVVVSISIAGFLIYYLYWNRRPKVSKPPLPTADQLDWPPPSGSNSRQPRFSMLRGRSRYIQNTSAPSAGNRYNVPSVHYESNGNLVLNATLEHQEQQQQQQQESFRENEISSARSAKQRTPPRNTDKKTTQQYTEVTNDRGHHTPAVERSNHSAARDLSDDQPTEHENIYANTGSMQVMTATEKEQRITDVAAGAADVEDGEEYSNIEEIAQIQRQRRQQIDGDVINDDVHQVHDDSNEVYANIELPKHKAKSRLQ